MLVLCSAASCILVHSHPSGDSTPSNEDVAITRRVVQACELLGIRVLDHVIIGADRSFSFADSGQLCAATSGGDAGV